MKGKKKGNLWFLVRERKKRTGAAGGMGKTVSIIIPFDEKKRQRSGSEGKTKQRHRKGSGKKGSSAAKKRKKTKKRGKTPSVRRRGRGRHTGPGGHITGRPYNKQRQPTLEAEKRLAKGLISQEENV